MSLKHKKSENSGLIYKGLVNVLAEATASNNVELGTFVKLIFERYFSPGMPLDTEYRIHNTIQSNRGINERIARRVVYDVLGEAGELDMKAIRRAKVDVLREAYDILGFDILSGCEAWPCYKSMAATSALISSAQRKDITETVASANLEEDLIKYMSMPPQQTQSIPDKDAKKKLSRAVENFNKQYSDTLSTAQMSLLDSYIVGLVKGDSTRYKRLASLMVEDIKETICETIDELDDDVAARLKEVVAIVEKIDTNSIGSISDILEAQNIVEEIRK